MNFFSKKNHDEEEVEPEIHEKKRRDRSEEKKVEPKDPSRFIALILFVIFLFISYIFWVQ